MGKRKVSILESAATAVAEIALFIESEGLPQTAKKFVDVEFPDLIGRVLSSPIHREQAPEKNQRFFLCHTLT